MFGIRRSFVLLIIVLLFAALLTEASANGDTVMSSAVYTVNEYVDTPSIDMALLKNTSVFNWQTKDGVSLDKRTVNGLGSYLLSFSSSTGSAELRSSLSERINAYDYRELTFAVRVLCGETLEMRQNCDFILTLSSYNKTLECKGKIASGNWSVISFDISAFKARHDITGINVKIIGENDSVPLREIEFSGPYVKKYEKPGMEKFMSYGLYASGSELEVLRKGTDSEALRIYLGSQRVSIAGDAAVPCTEELCNAVRIVLSNNSALRNMQFVYTYLDGTSGKYVTASKNVALEAGANKFPYLIATDDVTLISSFALILDSASEGSVTIHSIEPISVYDGYTDEPCGEISTCSADTSGKALTIKGSVYHSFLISHANYSLACYKLRAGDTLESVIARGDAPIAKEKMSSRFSFEIKTAALGELALVSKYAVAAISESGEYTLIAPPVSVKAKFGVAETASGRTNIKGVDLNDPSGAIDSGAGSAVIDVYLDKLTSSTHAGHLHSVGDAFIYFDADYVRELDGKIKNLYASDCKVYLRLLISADADTSLIPYASSFGKSEKTELLAVNIANKKAEEHFFATVDFIAGRYSSQENGKIAGLILGKTLDIMEERNYLRVESVSDYALAISRALDLMARTAALSIPGIEIVLPVSDRKEPSGSFDIEQLLTSVCLYFDECGGLEYSLMLESTHAPYSDGGEMQKASEGSSYYCTDNLYTFERMLDYLSRTFGNAPLSYMYSYSPRDLDTETLTAVYIYNYYSIMFSETASSFILSLPDGDEGALSLSALSELMKYIDTERNRDGDLAAPALEFFGAESLKDLIESFDTELIQYRVFSEADPLSAMPESVKGSYILWDFSSAFGTLGWSMGRGCRSLYLDTVNNGEKVLCAAISGAKNDGGYSDIVYRYEYSEDISSMPYIEFELEIDAGDDTSLYEIMVIIGGDGHRIESKRVLRGSGKANMIIDVSSVSDMKKIDYLRLCVRKSVDKDETDEGDDYKFYLNKITAHSDKLGDEALRKAVKNARAKARNTTPENDGTLLRAPNYELISAVLVIVIIGVLMVAFYEKRQK